jgi:hypothetical protein
VKLDSPGREPARCKLVIAASNRGDVFLGLEEGPCLTLSANEARWLAIKLIACADISEHDDADPEDN